MKYPGLISYPQLDSLLGLDAPLVGLRVDTDDAQLLLGLLQLGLGLLNDIPGCDGGQDLPDQTLKHRQTLTWGMRGGAEGRRRSVIFNAPGAYLAQ